MALSSSPGRGQMAVGSGFSLVCWQVDFWIQVDKEVTKVVEEVNKKLVLDKEADVEVNQEVHKEMAKVVEEVNKKLVLD